jgi:hypothetical protein
MNSNIYWGNFFINRLSVPDYNLYFGCEIDGKTIHFEPVVKYIEDERYTESIAISEEIFWLNCEEIQTVGAVFEHRKSLMQSYYTLFLDHYDYPYSRTALEYIEKLPLNDEEITIINSYKNQLTYIYLIKDRQTGFIKIGRSNEPQTRLRTLIRQDTLLPQPNDFHFLFLWEDYPYIEKVLHEKYNEKRKRGEWFGLSTEDLEEIHKDYSDKDMFQLIHNE